MNIKPKISILMPIYNEEKFILEAVQSVLDQSFEKFELIVIDNGSDDDSTNLIIENFDDERLRLIELDKKGKNLAFNKGFEVSKGDWIIYLAGDDILPLNSLETRYNKVKKTDPSNEIVFACGKYRSISKYKNFNDIIVPKNKDKGVFSGGTLIFSRYIATKIFPLPLSLPNEDTWTNLFAKYFSDEILHIPEIVLQYRIHDNNSQSRFVDFNKKSTMMHDRRKAYNIFLNKYKKELSENKKNDILLQIKAESYRYNNKLLKLLFLNGLNFRDRIKYIFYGNKFLYKLKQRFYSFFVGR